MSARRAGERGSALLELALSATLLVVFFTGVFQVGYTFYAYNVLQNAVRAGARYASLRPYVSNSTTPDAAFASAVRNQVAYGDPEPRPGSAPILAGLAPSNVAVTVTGGPSGGTVVTPAFVTVSIKGFKIDSIFSIQVLEGRPQVTFPYTGVASPTRQ